LPRVGGSNGTAFLTLKKQNKKQGVRVGLTSRPNTTPELSPEREKP